MLKNYAVRNPNPSKKSAYRVQIKIALRMCQDGLIAHIQQAFDFVLRDDVADPAGLVDGQFNENVITLPGKQPAFLQCLRPGLRNEAVFH